MCALGVTALGEKPQDGAPRGKTGPCGGTLMPASWGLRPPRTPPQRHRSPQGPGPWGGGTFEAQECGRKGPRSEVAATSLGSPSRCSPSQASAQLQA